MPDTVYCPELRATTNHKSLQPRSMSLHPHQHQQDRDLEADQRFSKLRCIFSIISYLLMLSDVPRAGLGVRDLSLYSRIEPEQLIFFGPYAYPVTSQLLKNATGASSSRSWSYKYDSTSVAMRAVATHLAIPEWSTSCVTTSETCDARADLPRTSLFQMIDSLIEGVKTHENKHQPNGQVRRLRLRAKYEWSDRLHDYVFPWFFSSPRRRTIQATHYDMTPNFRAQREALSLCSSPNRHSRPLTCGESWTNFDRLCPLTNPYCQDVGNVHSHIPSRLARLLEKFPSDHTMDFVLLEGVDDLSRSSLTSRGYKNIDVVTLARIRKCASGRGAKASTHCETILVDDFRYEMAPLVTNVREWFWIIAIIRGAGQLYAWMRLVFLLVGCFFARAGEPRMQQSSYVRRVVLTVRTLFLLPSQVIVYGSLFPISCYLVAHLIDAAVVYDFMAAEFSTILGVMSLDVWQLLRVCAVSMRSLWLLAFICHAVHRVATHCGWSPIHGVPGVPEFSLSFVASLTILAQVRYPSLRDARILSVHELVPSLTRYQCNSMQSDSSRGLVYKLLFGTLIDYKCLAALVMVHFSVVVLLRLVNRLVPRWFSFRSVLFSRTVVHNSVGSLWPRSALVVSWNSTFLAAQPRSPATPTTAPLRFGPRSTDDALMVGGVRSPQRVSVHPTPQSRALTTTSEPPTALLLQLDRHEPLIFLMNLAVMTDPLTFLRLRVFRGPLIGVYRYTEPRPPNTTTCLFPLGLATSSLDTSLDWSKLELSHVAHSSELDWCDLLQCG